MSVTPVSRRLRILAFDPSLTTRLETSLFNQVVVNIPWEKDLLPGPIGEYVEVIDYDPASDVFYQPVDLNYKDILAQDGLAPSESNPGFHQQMVYAVTMTVIKNFERALGRVAFWADHKFKDGNGEYQTQFVRRLRIYPHALRDQNAYYSPDKKAILFGYFHVSLNDKNNIPGTLVFTCLSHDIIAHEVSHALLDGLHPRFNEASNPDVQAFHEAFSDIVALFQHFSYQNALEDQIRRTSGNLDSENLLSQLAQQFGQASGSRGALRDALGKVDQETGAWEPQYPNPRFLSNRFKPHDRGAILVAAVFRSFLLIYRSRTADLFRIATQGTGKLPEGDIHPDLTKRLAHEAAKCADRILQMCIRALDYCPPVDITFGDFLRAIITADIDYSPEDEYGFRIAFIQSFREWGIHPRSVKSLGVEDLIWPAGNDLANNLDSQGTLTSEENTRRVYMKSGLLSKIDQIWNLESDRYKVWKSLDGIRAKLWRWLMEGDSYGHQYADMFGLIIDGAIAKRTVYRADNNEPAIEIHAVRPAIRRNVNGATRTDLVVEITQRRRGYFDVEIQKKMDVSELKPDFQDPDFIYRAGCTILIDPTTQEVRRVMRTSGTINDDIMLENMRRFLTGETIDSGNAFEAGLVLSLTKKDKNIRNEPFAFLHQENED